MKNVKEMEPFIWCRARYKFTIYCLITIESISMREITQMFVVGEIFEVLKCSLSDVYDEQLSYMDELESSVWLPREREREREPISYIKADTTSATSLRRVIQHYTWTYNIDINVQNHNSYIYIYLSAFVCIIKCNVTSLNALCLPFWWEVNDQSCTVLQLRTFVTSLRWR